MQRRPLALAAIVTAAVTLAAGCGSKTGAHPDTTPVGTPATSAASPGSTASAPAGDPAAATFEASVPTVSDGSATVMIDHRAVKFPSTVTDAVWSPNGNRLAYVDATGNIAVAYPDGTHVQVLTKGSGIKRARPTWDYDKIAFSELKGGSWILKEVGVLPTGNDGADSHNETDWMWDGESGKNDIVSPAANVMTQLPPSSRVYGGLEYAAQEDKGSQHHVFVFDRNLRGNTGDLTFDGTDPALSPDGTKVVFVGKNGQLEVAGTDYPAHLAKPAAPRQVTFGADHPSHPAWSSDGSRIAFETAHDVESVASAPAAGASANPARQESAKPGVPTYQNVGGTALHSFNGADVVGAAIAVSQATYPAPKSGDDFGGPEGHVFQAILTASDSDAAAAVAAQLGGGTAPVLFTTPGKVDARVVTELTRLFGPCLHAKSLTYCADNPPEIKLVGTATQFPATAVNQLKTMGFTVTRITAADPASLGPAAAAENPNALYVVDPADHVDAAAAALGAAQNGTLLLTNGSSLPAAAQKYLNSVKLTPDGQPQIPVIAVGKNAAAALSASWSGKRSFKVTVLTGDSPAAQLELRKDFYVDGMTAIVAPPTAGLGIFIAPAIVIPVGGTSQDVATLMQTYGGQIRTLQAFDDMTPYAAALQAGLGMPVAPAASPVHAAS